MVYLEDAGLIAEIFVSPIAIPFQDGVVMELKGALAILFTRFATWSSSGDLSWAITLQ